MNKLASYLKTSNSNGTAAWSEWFSLHPRPIRLGLSSSTTWDWFVFGHRSMWSPLQFYQGPVHIGSSKTMQTMAWSCSGSTLARHERFLRRVHPLHPRITNLRPKMNNMDAGSFNYYPQTRILVHLHGLAPCFLTSKYPGLGCWTVHPSPLSLPRRYLIAKIRWATRPPNIYFRSMYVPRKNISPAPRHLLSYLFGKDLPLVSY